MHLITFATSWSLWLRLLTDNQCFSLCALESGRYFILFVCHDKSNEVACKSGQTYCRIKPSLAEPPHELRSRMCTYVCTLCCFHPILSQWSVSLALTHGATIPLHAPINLLPAKTLIISARSCSKANRDSRVCISVPFPFFQYCSPRKFRMMWFVAILLLFNSWLNSDIFF